MDNLPNIGRLSDAFTTASRELALVANLPALDDGQRLLQAIERLTRTVENLGTDMNAMRDEMNNKFDNLELRLSAELASFIFSSSLIIITIFSSRNHSARLYNSHITSRETPLQKLYDQRNLVIDGFPRDPATLMRLTG